MTDIVGGALPDSFGDTEGLLGNAYDYLYTSETEIRRLISSTGANQWIDDIPDDYDDFLVEVINDATGTINSFLERFHDPDQLYQSYWVRRRATYLACYYLTSRRGDPGIFGEHYDRIMGELDAAAEGVLQVPGVPYSTGMLAVMQNVTVDQRFTYSKSRVRKSISTDTSGREPLSITIPYEWFYY